MSSIRSRLPAFMERTSCAIFCCAKCPSAKTAAIRMKRSSTGSTPTLRTTLVISRSGACRWSPNTAAACCPGPLAPQDEALLAQARLLPGKSRGAMKNYALHTILADIWRIVGDANRYFASEEPWAKRKSDPVRMQTILFVTADVLRIVAIMVQPFMPSSMGKLLDLLGVAGSERHFAKAGALKGLTPGALLPPPVPVFPRYSEPEETLPPGAPPC